jgi:hypothetical protein
MYQHLNLLNLLKDPFFFKDKGLKNKTALDKLSYGLVFDNIDISNFRFSCSLYRS